eukprot:GHVQ01000947.1.p1 GENE.GHVQ01000947.1~~GHVQ01000947.1.p1  ORF type:complete len:951 (-),score=100.47 GHVQ01000947.1:1866-4718(-)
MVVVTMARWYQSSQRGLFVDYLATLLILGCSLLIYGRRHIRQAEMVLETSSLSSLESVRCHSIGTESTMMLMVFASADITWPLQREGGEEEKTGGNAVTARQLGGDQNHEKQYPIKVNGIKTPLNASPEDFAQLPFFPGELDRLYHVRTSRRGEGVTSIVRFLGHNEGKVLTKISNRPRVVVSAYGVLMHWERMDGCQLKTVPDEVYEPMCGRDTSVSTKVGFWIRKDAPEFIQKLKQSYDVYIWTELWDTSFLRYARRVIKQSFGVNHDSVLSIMDCCLRISWPAGINVGGLRSWVNTIPDGRFQYQSMTIAEWEWHGLETVDIVKNLSCFKGVTLKTTVLIEADPKKGSLHPNNLVLAARFVVDSLSEPPGYLMNSVLPFVEMFFMEHRGAYGVMAFRRYLERTEAGVLVPLSLSDSSLMHLLMDRAMEDRIAFYKLWEEMRFLVPPAELISESVVDFLSFAGRYVLLLNYLKDAQPLHGGQSSDRRVDWGFGGRNIKFTELQRHQLPEIIELEARRTFLDNVTSLMWCHDDGFTSTFNTRHLKESETFEGLMPGSCEWGHQIECLLKEKSTHRREVRKAEAELTTRLADRQQEQYKDDPLLGALATSLSYKMIECLGDDEFREIAKETSNIRAQLHDKDTLQTFDDQVISRLLILLSQLRQGSFTWTSVDVERKDVLGWIKASTHNIPNLGRQPTQATKSIQQLTPNPSAPNKLQISSVVPSQWTSSPGSIPQRNTQGKIMPSRSCKHKKPPLSSDPVAGKSVAGSQPTKKTDTLRLNDPAQNKGRPIGTDKLRIHSDMANQGTSSTGNRPQPDGMMPSSSNSKQNRTNNDKPALTYRDYRLQQSLGRPPDGQLNTAQADIPGLNQGPSQTGTDTAIKQNARSSNGADKLRRSNDARGDKSTGDVSTRGHLMSMCMYSSVCLCTSTISNTMPDSVYGCVWRTCAIVV